MTLQCFDIVKTPGGNIAMVKEVSSTGGCSVEFFEFQPFANEQWEKNAWWAHEELKLIGSMVPVIAKAMCNPAGNSGRETFDKFNAR